MTSSIKPPGGPKAPDPKPTEGPDDASGVGFERALEAADAGRAASAAEANSPEAVAQALRDGVIDIDTAVTRLVDRVVGVSAGGLAEAGRGELAAFLRTALEQDPNLQALLTELGGG